jgi:hypothetical protein
MSQFVGQNQDGSYSNDWLKNSIPFVPPNNMNIKGYLNETSTPVVCKDGTKKMQPSSPNAKYMDACINNGGVDNQKTNDNAKKLREDALAKSNEDALAQAQSKSPTKSGDSIFKKLAGAYNKNLIVAGVLVAGYFAYKKFKK